MFNSLASLFFPAFVQGEKGIPLKHNQLQHRRATGPTILLPQQTSLPTESDYPHNGAHCAACMLPTNACEADVSSAACLRRHGRLKGMPARQTTGADDTSGQNRPKERGLTTTVAAGAGACGGAGGGWGRQAAWGKGRKHPRRRG